MVLVVSAPDAALRHGEGFGRENTLLDDRTETQPIAHRPSVGADIGDPISDALKGDTDHEWRSLAVYEPAFPGEEYRAVHDYPGVRRNESIQSARGLSQDAIGDRLSEKTFAREAYTGAVSKVGWFHGATAHDVELAAPYALDVLGRLLPHDRGRYRAVYEDTDERIGARIERADRERSTVDVPEQQLRELGSIE